MYINKLLQTSEESNNPAYKLTMNKTQQALVDVIIRSIFEH